MIRTIAGVVLVALVACADAGPGRDAIDDAVYDAAHSASELVDERFQQGESGQYVDAGSYNYPTRLRLTYAFRPPIHLSVLLDHYDAELTDAGWTRQDPQGVISDGAIATWEGGGENGDDTIRLAPTERDEIGSVSAPDLEASVSGIRVTYTVGDGETGD